MSYNQNNQYNQYPSGNGNSGNNTDNNRYNYYDNVNQEQQQLNQHNQLNQHQQNQQQQYNQQYPSHPQQIPQNSQHPQQIPQHPQQNHPSYFQQSTSYNPNQPLYNASALHTQFTASAPQPLLRRSSPQRYGNPIQSPPRLLLYNRDTPLPPVPPVQQNPFQSDSRENRHSAGHSNAQTNAQTTNQATSLTPAYSGVYLSPTLPYHYSPESNSTNQDGTTTYYTASQHEPQLYSTLQQPHRSNSTLLPAAVTSPSVSASGAGYPINEYLPSINEIDELPLPISDGNYLEAYPMADLSMPNNVSDSNIPFIHGHVDSNSNLFEPYALDPDDPVDNEFTPFPVTGDAYEINAYGLNNALDTDEVSYETDHSFTSKDEDGHGSSESSVLPEYYQLPRFGDEDELEQPPEGEVPRRTKSTKGIKVKMIDGNLILDCEVSQQLLSKYPDTITAQDREFRYMRYQLLTCDPNDFSLSKFSLRQLCYFQPRQTEILIVITMYNEDDILLARTLQGVFKNIKHLCSKKNSSTWGKDAWKKIVVCIVSDGRTKINPRAQLLLALLGCYQEGFAKNMVNDKPVEGHIYEYTTMVDISKVKDGSVKLTTEKTVPVQLLFCLKEKNLKKINSHRWCFQLFAPILDPNIVVLLDAGTEPLGDSIYHLWKLFDRDQSVAGACGEIKLMLNPVWYKTMWEMVRKPIVYLQNFEYKTSNILDKPMESVFGFVTVLPGAFSAYRFVALQNDVNGVGPLLSYFKGETLHNTDAGLFTLNMYLAEDRILCFELVLKRGCNWILKYVKLASAKTDVPDQLPEFILQRRRWLNGSFFAAIYSLVHFYNIWHSSHSFIRLFFFHVQFFYQLINLLVSWFSLLSYFLVFRILTLNLADESLHMLKVGNVLSVLFLWLYLLSIVTTFVLSFGNKPKGTKRFYVVIVWFFAILMAYMIFAAVYMSVYAIKDILDDNGGTVTFSLIFKNSTFRDLIVATASTYALYFIGLFIFLDPWHMFTSFIQYILLSPAYINVLNIYAFCNIHDISWGTKGDTGVKLDLGVLKQSSTEGKFYIEIPTTNQEVDEAYTRQINVLLNPEPEKESPPDPEEEEKDYYAFMRSMTVLFWMVSNFVIIAVVLETGGVNQLGGSTTSTSSSLITANSEIFLTVILWIVAFMALFRFLGCVSYTILRLVGK